MAAEQKRFCPTCGKPMELVRVEEDSDKQGDPFAKWEIWHCLNCNEDWQINLLKNILEIKM